MSAYIGDVVKNGLVLYLDAANSKSYVSGSSTWFDLSGNNNSGSLTNGPAFSSDGKGSINFDAINDYVNTNYVLSNSAASISVWFSALTQTDDPASSLRPIIQQGKIDGASLPEGVEINMLAEGDPNAGKIRVSWGNATGAGYYHITATRYDDTRWYMATLSNNGTIFSFYINGNLISTGSTYTSVSTTTKLQIGGSSTIAARKFKGKIAQVSIYNRALSPAEILENYNATKSNKLCSTKIGYKWISNVFGCRKQRKLC
jgi:hypothetical protein